MQRAGRLILKEFGPQSVVIKGGHLEGGAKDFLFTKEEQFVWESPRIQTCHTHGTGCTFCWWITAELAAGAEAFTSQLIRPRPLSKSHPRRPSTRTWFWPSQPYNF